MFPTLFISHGAPTTALDGGLAAQAWAALGQRLVAQHGKPRAVLVVSPHTVAGTQAVLAPPAGGRLKAWHDFYGFPPALYQLQYSPPGEPQVAQALAAGLSEAGLPTAVAERAEIDHGVWVPLRSLFPAADVPVVQLAMSREWVAPGASGRGVQPAGGGSGAPHAARVGAAVAAMRERGELDGVLVVGSGSLTHNLRDLDRSAAENQVTRSYVQPFRDGLAGWLAGPSAVLAGQAAEAWLQLPGAQQAHPTDEHLLPLFFAWAAAGPDAQARQLHQSTMGGALAMDLWQFGH
jgi:4,5-DOPA dioxygenase extradiol